MGNQTTALTGNDRRQFLKLAGYGTLGLVAGGLWPGFNRFAAGQNTESEFIPDLDITLSARPDEITILPGDPTQVWRYHAVVNK